MRKNGYALLQTFLNGPALYAPEQVAALRVLVDVYSGSDSNFLAGIAQSLGIARGRMREDMEINPDQLCATFGLGSSDRSKPFAFSDGLAVIPVWGSLLHRDSYSDSYATGYDYIRNKYSAALADPDVEGIVLDVNSPGGHVMGNFELSDMIYESRGVKPSLAAVDGMAYSGGYSLGSSATKMVAIPSAGIGSIGVLMMHVSVEQFLAKHGIDINFIHAGEHKVDGNPFQELGDDVRTRFQASVDRNYDKFVSLVARNRGIDTDAVRATEAACFDAEEALSLGLIDAIQLPSMAVAAFRAELSGSTTNPQQGATKMANNTAATGGDGNASTANTADTAPAAAAPAVTTEAAAPAATAEDPVAAERARIEGITTCEEAKGRETLAQHFAYKTSMSVDDARTALAAAPKQEQQASTGNAFAAAMDSTENPNVGAGGGEEVKKSTGDQIAESWSKATGNPLRDK